MRDLEKASDWFVRLRSDDPSRQLETEFHEWIADSPENELNFEKCELGWILTGDQQQDPEIRDLIADAFRAKPGFWYVARQNIRGFLQQATGGTLRRLLPVAAIAAAILATALMLNRPSDPLTFQTAVGEQRTIALTDGSQIELNTGSTVRVSYASRKRTVFLDAGEATFSVAKDPARPFEVRALHGTIRAVGTQFNVQIAGTQVVVSMLEGLTEINPQGEREHALGAKLLTLAAGQGAAFGSSDRVIAITAPDLSRVNAWRSHRIEFNNKPLQEALADYNRYAKKPMYLTSAELANRRISGSIRIGDARAMEFALGQVLPLTFKHEPDRIVLVKRSGE